MLSKNLLFAIEELEGSTSGHSIMKLVLPNILLFIVLFGEYLNLQRDKSTLGNKTISRTFKVLALS